LSGTDYIPQPSLSLFSSQIPRDEFDALSHVDHMLSSLRSYVSDFQAAVALLSEAKRREGTVYQEYVVSRDSTKRPEMFTYFRWGFMARREAVMAIFHVGHSLQALASALGKCPYVRSRVDHDQIKAARRLFESSFPTVFTMRNAVAHSSENAAKPMDHASTVTMGDSEQTRFYSGFVQGDRFTYTYKSEEISAEINIATADILLQVYAHIWDGYNAAKQRIDEEHLGTVRARAGLPARS